MTNSEGLNYSEPMKRYGSFSSYGLRRRFAPYMFLMPYLLLTCAFFVYPFINAIILAFYQTNGPKSRVFVGFDNFAFVLTDPVFHKAVINTVIFAIFSIAIQIPLSLGLAMMLNNARDKSKSFFRLLIFCPNLVGQIFVGVIFQVIFIPRYGLFNRFVQSLVGWGLENEWLNDPKLVMPAIIITAVWLHTGFNMIYFLAGLQNVNQSLVDSARIDGANNWQVFVHIILPALKPVMTFVVVISTIGAFQLFELPYALLRGTAGPANSGMTIVRYLFHSGFQIGDLGTAAAVGWILAFIIFTFAMIQIKISGTLKEGI